MNEEKIIDLETRITYQDDTLQELSDIIYQQQKQIDQLNKMMELMLGKLQDISQNQSGSQSTHIADEKPPHY